ncbi:MAG TPA: F0F1 ATP synthase subunit delta [Candidatus Saccharimonadales bacterium]|nr:F0F1 ATP synthase subunit delta [Candidatus Saccharimonadales bacterium]
MAKIGRRRLAREVVRLLVEQSGRRADLVQQIAAYLIDTKQVHQADLLLKDVADELYVQNKQLSADVTSAFDLTTEAKAAITDLLRASTGATEVQLETRKDPDLLGGVIVRTPRQEIDASVRRKLKALSAGGMN